MSSQTDEHAFENHVENILHQQSGWSAGAKAEWDVERALFPVQVWAFLEATQQKLWAEMRTLHGAGLEALVVNTLVKELDVKGMLHVLRHGFKFYGKTFRMAFFKPAHGLNAEVAALYAQNRLTITRQVPCHPGKHDTVDLLFSLNGLPVATCELKNPGTHQTWRNAVSQYQTDRDPRAPLFTFKTRALVHFAADPDEVHMTTRLRREETVFLPFNRGSHPGAVDCGAGNPQHPSGYRTGYFWEEVLHRDSFLDILGHFMFVEKRDEKVDDGKSGQRRITKETVVFPRYHQLDAVRKIIGATRREGPGGNYLVQHSAGSGKTNSISWLSHRLASLHDEHDAKVFDCVVVITDRRVLDQQLQDAIYQIEHAQGVVKAIDQDSRQLANALIDGTKIVITTLQKFPFVLRGLLHLTGAESREKAKDEEKAQAKQWEAEIAKRRYAVIVDEAHSSQSGESARELKEILGATSSESEGYVEESPADWEDRLNQVMASRGRQPNVSFFAFTATPKGKTLELFGRAGASGEPEPIHLYSMRQAIEEGFILDVLTNYTTYKTYYRLLKAAEDDPALPKKKAVRTLAKFMTLLEYNIEQKTEVIIEHFRRSVMHRLGGRAKAMVVTSSRLHAVRYMLSFEAYLKENGYKDIRPLVAFSGTVKDPDSGIEYTEPGMNTDVVTGKAISEGALPSRFASPDYQVLLVANKYQTGFDQPLLHTMYVDKRLDGVQAVQTLSRLNRMIPGKDAPFVLDFRNEAEEIYRAFKPYYDVTTLEKRSEPAELGRLKHELDELQVYHWSEVEAFARIFYRPRDLQNAADHAHMQRHLQPAVDRFKVLDEETRDTFRDKLNAYVRMYAFLSQIIPWADPDLEMLYSFGRFLKLPREASGFVTITDEVDLEYYRMERIFSGAIDLGQGTAEGVKSPTAVGTSRVKDAPVPLSEIIDVINQRFGTEFNEEDRLFLLQIKEKACSDARIVQTALANPLDKFQIGIRRLMEDFMMQRMAENDAIVTRYMADEMFQSTVFAGLAREIFQAVHKREEQLSQGR